MVSLALARQRLYVLRSLVELSLPETKTDMDATLIIFVLVFVGVVHFVTAIIVIFVNLLTRMHLVLLLLLLQ